MLTTCTTTKGTEPSILTSMETKMFGTQTSTGLTGPPDRSDRWCSANSTTCHLSISPRRNHSHHLTDGTCPC
jgi:hypothetical protein